MSIEGSGNRQNGRVWPLGDGCWALPFSPLTCVTVCAWNWCASYRCRERYLPCAVGLLLHIVHPKGHQVLSVNGLLTESFQFSLYFVRILTESYWIRYRFPWSRYVWCILQNFWSDQHCSLNQLKVFRLLRYHGIIAWAVISIWRYQWVSNEAECYCGQKKSYFGGKQILTLAEGSFLISDNELCHYRCKCMWWVHMFDCNSCFIQPPTRPCPERPACRATTRTNSAGRWHDSRTVMLPSSRRSATCTWVSFWI